MVVLVIVLAAVALGAVVVALLARRALAEQRRQAVEASARNEAQIAAHVAEASAAAAGAEAADARATATATELEDVRRQLARFDPDVLWSLEQRRTERTWRDSVAPSPEVPSGLAEASHPLVAALQIEMDALREEVGTVVELDAEISDDITPAGSVLTLRVAQELLSAVVRRAEETVLRVRIDDGDIVLAVRATDENGDGVTLEPLGLPVSTGVEQTADGARVRGATVSG